MRRRARTARSPAPIFALTAAICLAGFATPSMRARATPPKEPKTPSARLLAHLTDLRITESSGLARSERQAGLLWTHNDSGDGPFLYAIDRSGRTITRCTVPGAKNVDWEDIANGPDENGAPAIYIGDIGDNLKNRTDVVLYRIGEPKFDPRSVPAEIKSELPDKFPFRYPDGPHDAETLLVHPRTGEVLIVTKEGDGHSGIYAFPRPLKPSIQVTLEKVGSITFKSRYLGGLIPRLATGERMATGGAVSPDGSRVVIRTYLLGYEWVIARGESLARALQRTPAQIVLPLVRQGESICYGAGGESLLMTSEGLRSPLYELAHPAAR